MNIVWIKEAQEDLLAIYDYCAMKNEDKAVNLYNSILKETDILLNFPNLAPIEPLLSDLPLTFRSLVIKSGRYKIIYFIKDETIYITHVWDCRQNPNRLPDEIKQRKR